MDTYLAHEIEEVLSVMRRQNKEIEKLVLKEDSMKVIKCTGKPQKSNFDLRKLNKNLIR